MLKNTSQMVKGLSEIIKSFSLPIFKNVNLVYQVEFWKNVQ